MVDVYLSSNHWLVCQCQILRAVGEVRQPFVVMEQRSIQPASLQLYSCMLGLHMECCTNELTAK